MKLQYLPTLAAYFICSSSLYAADVQLGGFIKANTRFVEGNVAFQDSWTGGGKVVERSKRTQFGAQESRVNLTLNTDEAKAFAEIDFVGSSQGNPIISNSYSPRLRHAFISYQGVTAGQTWSTLVNTSTFAETADLGGPLVGQAMVRQALIRYSTEQWQFALENPYSYGTQAKTDGLTKATPAKPDWIDTSHDYIPDMIARYNQSGEWGNVSLSGLVRYLDPAGTSQWAGGLSLAAKLFTFGQDDLRLQLHYGHLGRYVGTDAARDIIQGELETTTSAMFAYRHFWTDYTRSSVFFGHTSTEREQTDRSHFGVNLFTNLTPALTLGFEVGRYQIEDNNSSVHPNAQQGMSNYAQLSAQLQL